MRMKFIVVLVAIVVFFVVLCPILFPYDFPLVSNGNQTEQLLIKDTTQAKFNPIESIDFSSGDNVAYLLFERTDIKELPRKMSKKKLFECHSNEILQNLQRDFIFINSYGGDMATCESKILIYKGTKLVFCSSFVLTDSIVGIQNSIVGWADAQNKESLKNSLLQFKSINTLIVILPNSRN